MLSGEGIGHQYQGGVPVIERVDLRVGAGEIVCVVGPSGCGKSTLLRIVGGLLFPSRGSVMLQGQPVREVPSGLAMVFQSYERSLLPWLRVDANVEFPLRGRVPRHERVRRRADALAAVGLVGHNHKYPGQLSGGMQQRVALARALAVQPRLLLMDEPFASVDAQTRADLEDLLLRLHVATGVTIVVVTHDIDESVYLADRVVVLSRAPSRVLGAVDVDLPRPRDQLTTKELPQFWDIRRHITELLRTETSPLGLAAPRCRLDAV